MFGVFTMPQATSMHLPETKESKAAENKENKILIYTHMWTVDVTVLTKTIL